MSAADSIADLTRINTADMLNAFGVRDTPVRGLLELLCIPAARRFAQQMLTYDALVGAAGLQVAGAWLIGQLAGQMRIHSSAVIPPSGPVLILSNHPGLYDTIALFAAIPRPDLRTIAADRPFLRALPHANSKLLSVRDAASDRASVIRRAAKHLRTGGTVLSFPAGTIEPDPASLPGAAASLDRWTPTAAAFARLCPNLTVVPVLVSGVLSRRALTHPVARLRPAGPARELLAATLQVAVPQINDAQLCVHVGTPFVAGVDPDAVVRGQMLELLRQVGGTW